MHRYLDEVMNGSVEGQLVVRGAGRPPGVLRALLQQFGDDLDQLRDQCNLIAIDVDYRR
jgi:hypothetical protein